jgi:hypothetical protein
MMNRIDNGHYNLRMNPHFALHARVPYKLHDLIQGLVPSAFDDSRNRRVSRDSGTRSSSTESCANSASVEQGVNLIRYERIRLLPKNEA